MVLLLKLKVVVAFLEFQEKDHLVVADKLEARDAEVRVKRQVRLLGLGTNVLARPIILEETRRELDDPGCWLQTLGRASKRSVWRSRIASRVDR